MSTIRFPRIVSPPKGSFFLFGPRGTGKSTWARERFPDALRIDLLGEATYHELLTDPGAFAGRIRTVPDGGDVVVDEVQRLPGLLNEVHRAIEDRRLRFVLLGSSARKLKAHGTNLLAGRASWKTMFPLVPQEIGSRFDLERALRTGTIALVWDSEVPDVTLESYVQLYLREEIRAEAVVRNLPGFARFLPIAALFHGQTVNVSAIARDSGSARTTISGYLEILEDTLLAFRLPAFESKLRVRERKHPKLYWVDPGLVRAMKRSSGPVSPEERGSLLEGFVLGLLRAWREERPIFDTIAYWAPSEERGGTEVDFLLGRSGSHLAIEVKSARRLSGSILSGLRAIRPLGGLVRRILVYGGAERMRTEDGIDVWPLDALIEALAEDALWP